MKCVMSTGDDINTAISVATQVGIIPGGYTVFVGELIRNEVVWRS
jgi:magnesium-transporting ATPase (P-type)